MDYLDPSVLEAVKQYQAEYAEGTLNLMIEERNYVYICISSSQLLKIGFSKAKISNTYARYRTPYGNHFVLLIFPCVYDSYIAEQQIHELLDEERVSQSNELFVTSIVRALNICKIISRSSPYYITSEICKDLRALQKRGSEPILPEEQESVLWTLMGGIKNLIVSSSESSKTPQTHSKKPLIDHETLVKDFRGSILSCKAKSPLFMFKEEYHDVEILYNKYIEEMSSTVKTAPDKFKDTISLHQFRRRMTPFVSKKSVPTIVGERGRKTVYRLLPNISP